MPLFEIPYYQRIVNVTKSDFFFRNVEIMHVDEVGIFLFYDIDKQKDVNFIRKHHVKRIRGSCYIEANNVHKAIKRFYFKYEGARVGGPKREAKAMWINGDRFIYELPYCPLMHRNKRSEFICGKQLRGNKSDQEEGGTCVLEKYPAPDNCIMSLFYKRLYEREKELNAIAVNFFLGKENFKVIQTRNILPFLEDA